MNLQKNKVKASIQHGRHHQNGQDKTRDHDDYYSDSYEYGQPSDSDSRSGSDSNSDSFESFEDYYHHHRRPTQKSKRIQMQPKNF